MFLFGLRFRLIFHPRRMMNPAVIFIIRGLFFFFSLFQPAYSMEISIHRIGQGSTPPLFSPDSIPYTFLIQLSPGTGPNSARYSAWVLPQCDPWYGEEEAEKAKPAAPISPSHGSKYSRRAVGTESPPIACTYYRVSHCAVFENVFTYNWTARW